MSRCSLLALIACLFASAALAQSQTSQLPQSLNPLQQQWVVEEITDGSVPKDIVPDDRAIAPNGLPDGRVTTGTGDIAEAWYSEPTTRYAHAVLGDGIEAGALRVKNQRGEVYTFRLPSTEVFEDIANEYTMTVFPETSYSFFIDLTGTKKALELTRKCMDER